MQGRTRRNSAVHWFAAAFVGAGFRAGPRPGEEQKPMIRKSTPVLFVEEIEPCVKFWTERLGFEKTVEVPEGNKLGFVMLVNGNVELMYQSYASAEKDAPAMAQIVRKGPTLLYIEVENLEAIKTAIRGAEVVMPERTTFYGAREIGFKDPGGHFLTFAQFTAPPQH
jgi:uncharacterized glyoxalase superfamily protein PhnB